MEIIFKLIIFVGNQTLSMNQKRIILDLLISRKRINITGKNYFGLIRNLLLFSFLLIVLLNCVYLYYYDINWLSLAITLGNIVFFGLIFINLIRKTSATSIKGDTLILNNSNNKACVTSLRSIKRIQTISLLRLEITRLQYNLDGKDRKTYIFTRKNAYSFSPENLLRKAIELSKKQKANHKPGPVTV